MVLFCCVVCLQLCGSGNGNESKMENEDTGVR